MKLQFLKKAIAFETDSDHSNIASIMQNNVGPILTACRESETDIDGQQKTGYHPYYIDLAISMIRERAESFDALIHLGDSPEDLQKRFFKYMNPKEKKLHLILAILLRFNWSLLKSLELIKWDELDFGAFIRNHSYVIE